MIDDRELLRRASETIASPEDVMSSLIRRARPEAQESEDRGGVPRVGHRRRGDWRRQPAPLQRSQHPRAPPIGTDAPVSPQRRAGRGWSVGPSDHPGSNGKESCALPWFTQPLAAGNAGGKPYRMAMSPDGRKIAYLTEPYGDHSSPGNDQLGIYVLDLRSGKATRISPCEPVNCSWASSGIAWSPDGSRIAISETGGRITLMNADGGSPHVLVDMGTMRGYSVAPRGPPMVRGWRSSRSTRVREPPFESASLLWGRMGQACPPSSPAHCIQMGPPPCSVPLGRPMGR
jgi:hypothetical protein